MAMDLTPDFPNRTEFRLDLFKSEVEAINGMLRKHGFVCELDQEDTGEEVLVLNVFYHKTEGCVGEIKRFINFGGDGSIEEGPGYNNPFCEGDYTFDMQLAFTDLPRRFRCNFPDYEEGDEESNVWFFDREMKRTGYSVTNALGWTGGNFETEKERKKNKTSLSQMESWFCKFKYYF